MRLVNATALGALRHQVSTLRATLAGVSRVGHTLRLVGMNLQIEDGGGATGGVPNGLGNLIIGYNEAPGKQTGSHNLVLGNHQSFTGWAGIVGGVYNSLSGDGSVVFGSHNMAAGTTTSVLGGEYNLATDLAATVTGGCTNLAGFGNPLKATCGGFGFESVTGGQGNIANGGGASVTGGNGNTAEALGASVSGGYANTASAINASVLGGVAHNLATKCATWPDSGQSCP
jgi:hypothetical protein